MVEAVVQFDYAAQEPDELTLLKGDVITEIKIQPGGWWEGKLKGKRGMFPDNFVKVVGEDNSNPTGGSVAHRQNVGRRCKVLFSYHPANDDELTLKVNDIVEILDEVEEGWWKGRLRNQTGVFPSNFVAEFTEDNIQDSTGTLGQATTASLRSTKSNQDESSKVSDSTSNHNEDVIQSSPVSSLSTDSDVPVLPPKPVKELCKALYPYKALNDDELSLREGDIITLISRDGQDKGWWKGELHGQIGVFPDNFVQVIPVDEVSKPLRPPTKATSITTNRARDSITKPTTSSSGSPPSNTQSVTQKKALETPPKNDEKTSPPGVGKKPSLPPPPLKKPQRSPTGSNKQSISSPTFSENLAVKPDSPTPVNSARSPALSPAANNHPSLSQETSPVQSGKPSPGAKKRETTGDNVDGSGLSVFSANSGSFNLNHHYENNVYNNDSNAKSEIDLDCVGRTAMLTHPTASRVRAPRRRPPSSICTKEENQGVNSVGMMNGNVDSHAEHRGQGGATKSWLEELKMSQNKKQFSQGRTRVMIGTVSTSGGGESTSPEPPSVKPSTPTVVFRSNISPYGQRPQSMFSGEKTSPNTRPFSVIGTPSESITLTLKQWTDLNEKVSRLEATVDSQQEMFTKMFKELTSRLNEETERVLQMQLEIEKLTDLVTQV